MIWYCKLIANNVKYSLYRSYSIFLSNSIVFAKAGFTNLSSTKKIRILFVKSEVEMDLRKRNRFSTKYLTGRKKNVGGNNLWSRSTKFENIVEFVTLILWNSTIFLCPTYFLWNRICEFRFRKLKAEFGNPVRTVQDKGGIPFKRS